MRLNYETCIVGSRCILVPYRKEHVEKYHEWMLDPHLLEATGSEPLSLKEEFEMQESWRDDNDKCTFIVLDKEKLRMDLPQEDDEADHPGFCVENLHAMVGDVNLFLSDIEKSLHSDDDEHEVCAEANSEQSRQGEIDIMVAEKDCRGKGIGKEACILMMSYGATFCDIQRFFCKINHDNETSIALFNKLGYQECAYAEVFRQFEYEFKADSAAEMSTAIQAKYNIGPTLHRFNCSIEKAKV